LWEDRGLAIQHDQSTREGWQGPCKWTWPARPLAEYAALGGRNQAIAVAYRPRHYTMQQIADYSGVRYATEIRAVRREGV